MRSRPGMINPPFSFSEPAARTLPWGSSEDAPFSAPRRDYSDNKRAFQSGTRGEGERGFRPLLPAAGGRASPEAFEIKVIF